jgi:hypothetical protein
VDVPLRLCGPAGEGDVMGTFSHGKAHEWP